MYDLTRPQYDLYPLPPCADCGHHRILPRLLTLAFAGMANDIWAIPLAVTDFNVIVALLGGFVSLFGLVSYLLKESYYMSEASGCRFSLFRNFPRSFRL